MTLLAGVGWSDPTHRAPGEEHPKSEPSEPGAPQDILTGVETTSGSSIPPCLQEEPLSETNRATKGRACTKPGAIGNQGEDPIEPKARSHHIPNLLSQHRPNQESEEQVGTGGQGGKSKGTGPAQEKK